MNIYAKTLREITLAGCIGAVIGLIVASVLATEFGFAWMVFPVSAIIGTLSAGVCYRHEEVWLEVRRGVINAKVKWSSKWKHAVHECLGKVFEISPSALAQDFFDQAKVWAWENLIKVVKFFYVICAITIFCVSSRYTIGLLMNPAGFFECWIWPAIIAFVLFLAIVGPFEGLRGKVRGDWASWKMPISCRILVWFNRKQKKAKQENKEPVQAEVDEVPLWFYLVLWVIGALLPIVSILLLGAVVIYLPVAIIDGLITVALALASTERLAAMFGGLFGTTAGYFCILHGWPHIVAVVAGGTLGGLAGRWLYQLRMALTYKAPLSVAA